MRGYFFLALLWLFAINLTLYGQAPRLSGVVKDTYSNEPLAFVNIIIDNTTIGTTTNIEGEFEFENVESGFLKLRLSSVGYETLLTEEIMISPIRSNFVELSMTRKTTRLDEVVVQGSLFIPNAESPVSLRRIGIEQIEKGAGAARDIGKVLQSFPGVGGTVSFRNDLIVRGGGPSENRFFLDGIEIPVLNHFSTQGASGGPVGLLNVDFIREVEFYSGAFPADRGNALSSVFEFKQIDANKEKPRFKATLGASELSLSGNAPLSEKTGALFSVRRSYLQFLFDAIGLPFLPTFNDFQFRTRTRFDKKNELILLGVGAIDQFKLNPSPKPTEENRYIVEYLPVNEQWNYAVGANYKHFLEDSYFVVVLSRNHLNNTIYKFQDNREDEPDMLNYDYASDEVENKLRFEHYSTPGEFKLNMGANLELAHYYNRTFARVFRQDGEFEINYKTDLDILKYGLFGSISRSFHQNKFSVSLGTRFDANSYSAQMNNPLKQFSPRLSLSYKVAPQFGLNFNTGRYFQLPPYTALGYREYPQELTNKKNKISYIRADHFIGGVEWLPNSYTKVSLEGFLKRYANYPFSVLDSVSLASKGGDFGVLGAEEVTSGSDGKTYGAELLVQQRSPKGYSYILAYTWVRSRFSDGEGQLVPSSWDSKHLLTFTFTRSLPKNWDVGLRWRYLGGLPYTPYDYERSSRVDAWNLEGREFLDFSRFNEKRLDSFHQLDLRVDKSWLFPKFSLGVYLDIQNVYNKKGDQPPRLVQRLDDNEDPIVIPPQSTGDVPRYDLKELTNTTGTVLPTVGVILEF